MKSILSSIAFAAAITASFSIHANDLRDVKESELTTEHKKEIFSKMSNEEIELIDNYENPVNYKAVISGVKAPDISYNEKLKVIRNNSKN